MEILTGKMDNFFSRFHIKAIKKWEQITDYFDYQIWELNKEEFDKLLLIDEDKYMDNEFWNSAESSNMDKPTIEYIINGKKIKAWDGTSLGFDEDYYAECEDNHDYNIRDYCDLLDYMCEELGASQPRNVVALAVDLAKYNNMTMAELFTTYQKG